MITKYLNEISCVSKAYDIAVINARKKIEKNSEGGIYIVHNEEIRNEFQELTDAELVQVGPKPKKVMPDPFNSIRFKSEADLTMFLLKWS
jgi:hypothetical protein